MTNLFFSSVYSIFSLHIGIEMEQILNWLKIIILHYFSRVSFSFYLKTWENRPVRIIYTSEPKRFAILERKTIHLQL